MFQVMTAEEIAQQEARLRELRAGSKLDQLTALLMDPAVGGSGFHEATARDKARAILLWEEQSNG